ncbi:MAG: polysaccharide biosynthesis tyrosine autokinase [Prevotella sp.]|nr:polysaccharide biosynthesis tyrosine autokinase [Prevotella sp.]
MEENKNLGLASPMGEQEETSSINFQTIYTAVILHWKWFVLSLIICMGCAMIYLRYKTPVYQAYAKLLIKDDDSRGRGGKSGVLTTSNLGIMSNSTGIDNEMEILSSLSIAQQAVRDLKLYVNYSLEGKVKDHLIYNSEPISVDLDPSHLEKLNYPISLEINRKGSSYTVTGEYLNPKTGVKNSIEKTITSFPTRIDTKTGIITLQSNGDRGLLPEGRALKVTILSPKSVAAKYAGSLSVSQTSKTTTIAELVLKDESPQRAVDYLRQLAICYNRQANEDKNEIAVRTEEFINGRLEKINAELGSTEGSLEEYKKRNNMVELKMNAAQAVQNQDVYSQKLAEANTQMALLNSISEYMNDPSNKYQTLPSNVGLSDASATSLIDKYNDIVITRNRLLRSASESSPTVTPLTAQLDDLTSSIQRAMIQARKSMEIERNNIANMYGRYASQTNATPEQERILTQIGRQQDVKSGLYLMLLQKREENSISLAATADKGKLIDDPQYMGKVSPKNSMIMLIALIMGLAIPAGIIFVINFMRYKIEGHDDVAKLTSLPIIADVAIASETAKTKADIVVHENQNNQMEEVFRSLRTNLQFVMAENEKVILFTSSTSGEGKTFTAANLAVSFALLDKKVVLVGLDIRKPRLAELFEINDHQHGITNLLTQPDPTAADVKKQILKSGISNNLDILMAGPIPPNPAELVARKSLDQVIDILKETYDYVLIDSAPVGLVTDTLQIGRVANATVFLCRADYTPKEAFDYINDLAKEKKLPNMCVVINGIDMSKKKYGYYYGYGRYGKYGRYGRYGRYGHKSGTYGSSYGKYTSSHYGDVNDTSVKQ